MAICPPNAPFIFFQGFCPGDVSLCRGSTFLGPEYPPPLFWKTHAEKNWCMLQNLGCMGVRAGHFSLSASIWPLDKYVPSHNSGFCVSQIYSPTKNIHVVTQQTVRCVGGKTQSQGTNWREGNPSTDTRSTEARYGMFSDVITHQEILRVDSERQQTSFFTK